MNRPEIGADLWIESHAKGPEPIMSYTVIVRFPSLNHVEAFSCSFLNPRIAFLSLLEMIAQGFDAQLIRTAEQISLNQKVEERVFVSSPAGIVELRFNEFIPNWKEYRENYLPLMADPNFLEQMGRVLALNGLQENENGCQN